MYAKRPALPGLKKQTGTVRLLSKIWGTIARLVEVEALG
jgi:hypothetical protein